MSLLAGDVITVIGKKVCLINNVLFPTLFILFSFVIEFEQGKAIIGRSVETGTIVEVADEDPSPVMLGQLLPCQKYLQLKQKITADLLAELIQLQLQESGITRK